jgi:hypothetical protein
VIGPVKGIVRTYLNNIITENGKRLMDFTYFKELLIINMF